MGLLYILGEWYGFFRALQSMKEFVSRFTENPVCYQFHIKFHLSF